MKISEVQEGVAVEHVRRNQTNVVKPVSRKIGRVTTAGLFSAPRSKVADLVEVEFWVDGRKFIDRVRYNKLKVLPETVMLELAIA